MIRIKKMCMAVVTMGLSSIASAGMYETTTVDTGCGADSVTVGCPRVGWDLGLEGIYVRANDFGQSTAIDDGAGYYTFQKITPKWTLGFRLQGSYHWSTANDMTLNWTHFNKETSETTSSATLADPEAEGFLVGGPFTSIDTTLSNHADIINFEIGQGVSYGDHVLARYHGGAQFARVTRDITQTGYDDVDAITASVSNNSEYSGAGPRAGIDLQYGFGNGFSVVCDAAGTLLYGKRSLDLTFPSVGPVIAVSSADITENVIVPGTDAKVGVKFAYPMSIGDFSIEGGYRIANYWQAVNRTSPTATGDIGFGAQDDNFAYQGVYLGLYWLENG